MNHLAVAIVLTVLPLLGLCHAAELPKYQAIVYPEVFEGRDEGTRALKVTDDITLNLEPSSILHENFFVRTYRQGVAQHRYFNVETLQRGLYHDKRRYAAVVLSEDGDTLQVEGVVGPNLKIRPIEMNERSENGRQAHLLETIDDSDSDNVHGVFPEGQLSVLERADKKRTGFDASAYNIEMVFPEIFFIMDSRLRAGFNSTAAAMKYLMVALTVVNLRYRTVSNPKVQLILRGVEFSEHSQEVKYYNFLGNGGIDGLKSLYGIVEFVKKKNDTYGSFDMVYFSTGYDMYAVEGSTYQQALSGFAFVASACIDTREQLGEDTAYSYRMIRIAAHEVAHTLGCPHDGTSIEGHIKVFRPDATNCPWEQGHIMSYLEENGNSMKFSSCCNYQMSLLSWTYEAECLRRNDSVTTIEKQWFRKFKLPGEVLSKNRQCRMTYPDLVQTYYMPKLGIQNCIAQCFVPGYQFQGANGNWPMILIDGSTCRKNPRMLCINGDCVPDRRTQRPKNLKNSSDKLSATTEKAL